MQTFSFTLLPLSFSLSLSLPLSLSTIPPPPIPLSPLSLCPSCAESPDAAVEAYSQLTGAGVLLRPALLSRLLDLTRELGQPMLGTCVSLVLGILQSIRDQGPCHIEHYHSTLKILESARKPVELVCGVYIHRYVALCLGHIVC